MRLTQRFRHAERATCLPHRLRVRRQGTRPPRHGLVALIALTGGLALLACDEEDAQDYAATATMSERAGSEASPDVAADSRSPGDLEVRLTLESSRARSDPLPLGAIRDAIADSAGLLFIIGDGGGRVAITDRNLRTIGSLDRDSTGAALFQDPVSLALVPGQHPAVLDRTLRRVTVLSTQDGTDAVRIARVVRLSIPAEDMCALADGTLLIYGFIDGMRLHVVDAAGESLRSFAPADPELSPMAQHMTTLGRIACDREHDEVLVTSAMTPVVEAYRISTGKRTWQDALTPFRPPRIIDKDRSVTFESGAAGYSRIVSVFSVGDYRVLQTIYDARLDEARRDTILTYVYSRRDRAWSRPDMGLPVLHWLGGDLVLSRAAGRPGAVEVGRLSVADAHRGARDTVLAR
jgi:hypothetical protein